LFLPPTTTLGKEKKEKKEKQTPTPPHTPTTILFGI